MEFVAAHIDLILVPAGLLIMFTYHLYLLYRILKYPATTAIDYENHNWMAWVVTMMQGDTDHTSLALTVISSNTSSVTFFASLCLTLSSFIGAWVGNSSTKPVNLVFILGDTSAATLSLKNISMLLAFMLAFGSFVQSVRSYVQANSLISMPKTAVPVEYVQRLLLRGNNFWQLGLRLLYFALAFLFWSFGPIPMFASCVIMVVLLYFLDSNSEPLHLSQLVAKLPKKEMNEVRLGHSRAPR